MAFRSVLALRLSTLSLQRIMRTISTYSTKENRLPRLNNKILFNVLFHVCLFVFFYFYFLIRLPVPKLAETAQKYLKTVAPLLNNDEFNETKKVFE